MATYLNLNMPKPDALALLTLCRFAERNLDRPVTVEERRAIEKLEFALEGKDRRKVNRYPKPAPRPRVELDLRRRPA